MTQLALLKHSMRTYLWIGLLVFAGGCGSGTATPSGDQATVSGSVTNDGKPVALDTAVTFYNVEKSITAGGKVDTLGKFSLTGGDPAAGIPAGRYQVMIRPPAAAPVGVSSGPDYEAMMKKGGAAKPAAPQATQSDIPAKFQSLDTSGIVLELKAGPNNFDFDLVKLGK